MTAGLVILAGMLGSLVIGLGMGWLTGYEAGYDLGEIDGRADASALWRRTGYFPAPRLVGRPSANSPDDCQ